MRTCEEMLVKHFLDEKGQPRFDFLAAPLKPLNGVIFPYFLQRALACRGMDVPMVRFDHLYSSMYSAWRRLVPTGKRALIVMDYFWETPTLRRHCGCQGPEYFNLSRLQGEVADEANRNEVVGTIGISSADSNPGVSGDDWFDHPIDFWPVAPVAVIPSRIGNRIEEPKGLVTAGR